MHLTWNHLGRLFGNRHLVPAMTAAAAMLIALPAGAETSVTVTAGTAEAEVGVKSYEVSTETEPVTDDTYWFCQVVGKPSIAGSVTVTTANGNTSAVIRHAVTGSEVTVMLLQDRSIFVTKAGVQVASLIPAPPGSGLPPATTGFSALDSDPAWQIFTTAVGDANLQPAIDSLAELPSGPCQATCDANHPIPDNCEETWASMTCCEARCDLDYCKMDCNCDTSASPTICRAKANIWHLLAMTRCVRQFYTPTP